MAYLAKKRVRSVVAFVWNCAAVLVSKKYICLYKILTKIS